MKKDWMIRESELDDDQIKVLMATLNKSCIVSGCAGSGKSVLALIKAQRIQRELGEDYQIIVFTRALCGYMNAGRQSLGLTRQFAYHYDWKNRHRCPSSSYVIVDEIQDFSESEIREFINATRSNFFFFGDSAQSIYNGMMQNDGRKKYTLPVDDIRVVIPEARSAKCFSLYRNYRLPKPVARVVQSVGVDLEAYDEETYKSLEPAIPRFINYNGEDAQIFAVYRMIKDMELEDVAILLPRNDDVRRVYDKLTELGLNCEKKVGRAMDLDFSTTNPKIMTYHSAKGLQFEAVFLPFVEKYPVADTELDRKKLYVAMTRTYRYLYVMYSGSLPAPLLNVDTSLYATTEREEVEDI